MNAKAEAKDSRFDLVKWLVVAALVVVGVVGNQYFSAEPVLYRVLGLVVLGAVAAFVAFQTARGQSFAVLLKEARVEIRKVVWPTRQETTQTTLIVVAVVLVMALLLWGLDSLLVKGVSWLSVGTSCMLTRVTRSMSCARSSSA
jgi:preprotein translocase subunit SecE